MSGRDDDQQLYVFEEAEPLCPARPTKEEIEAFFEPIGVSPSEPRRRLNIWDLETSGLSPENDRILEIGLVQATLFPESPDRAGRVETLEHCWLLKHPGLVVSEEITRITGITQALIDAEGILPEMALAQMLAMLDNTAEEPIENVTHNGIRFDLSFLMAECRRQLAWHSSREVAVRQRLFAGAIDTAAMFKARQLRMKQGLTETRLAFYQRALSIQARGLRYNVAACCAELGIPLGEQHRALADCRSTLSILIALEAENAS